MSQYSSGTIPEEILETQRWVHEVFQEASRGLPWPQQAGLMAIEQVITLGMFGGLLASAWFLQELRTQSPESVPDIGPIIGALEAATLAPLPPAVQAVVHQLIAANGGSVSFSPDDFGRVASAMVGPLSEHFQQVASRLNPLDFTRR